MDIKQILQRPGLAVRKKDIKKVPKKELLKEFVKLPKQGTSWKVDQYMKAAIEKMKKDKANEPINLMFKKDKGKLYK